MSECCNQFIMEESMDEFEMWQGGGGAVKSVNGMIGDVVLTAEDVGALPDTYEAPVTSVNTQTGDVVLDAGDIAYESTTVEEELSEINSALTSLQSVTEIIDTASGAIASFPDGSGLPMRSLVAQINPVQDLHGQSSPYPAGGGKNLFNPDSTSTEWVNTSNQITTLLASKSCRISATAGEKITISNNTQASGSFVYLIACIDSSNNVLSRAAATSGYSLTATAPTNTASAIVGFSNWSETGTEAQAEKSATATAYAPYSNICPITGWTGLSVEVRGKNLASGRVSGCYINGSGTITDSSAYDMCYAEVRAGVTYTATTDDGSGLVCGFFSSTPAKYAISYNGQRIVQASKTITAPIDGYLAFRTSAGYSTPMLEVGSSTSSYEPYTSGTTTPVSWQDEAGTVYGGQDEIVGGELTSKMARTTFDGNSTVNDYAFARGFFTVAVSGFKAPASNATVANIVADRLKTVARSEQIAGKTFQISAGDANSTGLIGIQLSPDYNTVALAKQWLSANPVDVVFELATPQTFTHAGQQISTIYGQNNVWHDANGDTTVTYQANLKGYIDKVLGQ